MARAPKVPAVCLLVCLLAAGLAGFASADERAASTPSAAERVLAAWRDGKTYELVALARQDAPDPWMVADELCLLGAHQAALVFSRAAVRQDTARLADYVETREGRTPDTKIRAVLEAANHVETKEDGESLHARLDALLGQGDGFEQARLEIAHGNVLYLLEEYEEAAEAFLSAGRLAERLGWLSMAARVYEVSGDAAYMALRPESMLPAWEGLLRVQQGRENDAGIAKALMFVGLASLELGDTDQAHRYLRESLAANEGIGNDDGTAWVLNNLATLHHRRGEHQLEQAALERALTLARKVGNRTREAAVLCDQGALFSVLHDAARAREALQASMALHRELGDEAGVAHCLSTLALSYAQEYEYDRAIETYEEVLAHGRRTGDLLFTCAVLNGLGCVHLDKGELDRAEELAREALGLGEQLSDPWWSAIARQSLADVLVEQGRYDEAEQHLSRSLADARKLAAPHLMMVAHRGLAELWLAQGKPARAVRHSERALEQSQALLSGLAHTQAASVRGSARELYDVAARAAVAWGHPRAVFKALESARAGALLEALENRTEIRAVTIPKELRVREREAKLASLAALRRYQDAMKGGLRREIRQRRTDLENARERESQVVARIQRLAKAPASVLYPEAATLQEIQKELAASDAMLVYSLIGEEALALVVTQETAKTVSLGTRDAIVAAASADLGDPDEDRTAVIAALREKLIDPLGLPEGMERYLISPDGILAFTPFAALVPEIDVVYVPSGTAYRVLRQAGHEPGTGVLALGDPDYGYGTETRPVALNSAPRVRGGMRLLPLPATRAEAQSVGDVVLLGSGATKSAFLAALGRRHRWEAVHLACHGVVDPARPAATALALAFEEDGGNLLYCEEVFTSDVPADLTVLSACETGRGAVYHCEGLMGLAQAFMLAGSPRVLVSLWRVDDDATQALMLKFYELWRPKDGNPRLSAAAALAKAQAHVRGHEKWEHPHYWAAWVLWGLP